MTSRNKGQLRVGKSGAANVGSATQESSIKPKIGQSTNISAVQNINILKREDEELSNQRRESIEREREINEKKWLVIITMIVAVSFIVGIYGAYMTFKQQELINYIAGQVTQPTGDIVVKR